MSAVLDEDAIRAAGLTQRAGWADVPDPGQLRLLPDRPAVVLLTDPGLRPVLLAACGRLRSFLRHRFTQREAPTRRADLRSVVRRAYFRPLDTAFEQRWWYWKLARWLYPREYRSRIGFGPSWFLHLDPAARVPQITVSERVYAAHGVFAGPFATAREAQGWLERLWNAFDLCRFPEQLARSPRGTRCAYAEMGRCDAPCDGSAPLEPYRQRCLSAWAFICGDHDAYISRLRGQMQDAAASLAFERAAMLRDQLRFAERWQQEVAPALRVADRWCDLIVLPVSGRRRIKLLLFCRGYLIDGPTASPRQCAELAAAWLADIWPEREPPTDATARMEQAWLVSRLIGRGAEPAVLLRLDPHARPSSDLGLKIREAAQGLLQRGRDRPPAGAPG